MSGCVLVAENSSVPALILLRVIICQNIKLDHLLSVRINEPLSPFLILEQSVHKKP